MRSRCPHCHAKIPRPPHPVARFTVTGAAWIVVLAMAFGTAVLGPVSIALLPISMFASIALISGAQQFSHGDRVCDTCGRIYEFEGEPVGPEPTRFATETPDHAWAGHPTGQSGITGIMA